MTELTVAMPVYNAMPYLPEAVQSILGQTLRDFRFLIVNDGSTDSSKEYLDSIDDPRVSVIHQENRGLGATLNRTLELCETEYYARMDADDVSHRERLARQLHHLQLHSAIGLLSTQIRFLVGRREIAGPPKPLRHREIGALLIRGVYAVCHPSVMMRVSVANAIGGYRIAGAGQDLDFFLRIHEASEVENLPDALHLMRIHCGSINAVAQEHVQLGRAYAVECALRRRHGQPEPTLADFRDAWQRRGCPRRVLDAIDRWSVVQYRKALVEMGQSRHVLGSLRLALTASCRPGALWRRVRHLMGTRRSADREG